MDRLLFLHTWISIICCAGCCAQAHTDHQQPFQLRKNDAQTFTTRIGWNRCACQPQEYELAFDFSLTCANSTVEQNPGMEAFACTIAAVDYDNEDDTLPVALNVVQILELDAQQQVQSQIAFEGWKSSFTEGDRLWFASITGKARRLATDDLPTGLQIIIDAVSDRGTPIVASSFLQFKASCEDDSYPALREGDTAGWVRFRTLESPDKFTCPIVSSESIEATFAPTPSPIQQHHHHHHHHHEDDDDYVPHHHHYHHHGSNNRACHFWNLVCYFQLWMSYVHDGFNYIIFWGFS